jgi:quercetin dioxygenase-like cupin family protein
MKIVRNSDGQPKQGSTFSGKATLAPMVRAQKEGGMGLTMVNFEDGAVTNWHTHPGEQILYVMSGKGRVGDEEAQWDVEPGDVIHFGPGERHWHGAAAGHNMCHISVTNVGPPVWEDHAPDL